MHVFSATSVQFIMQMTNGKALLNNDAARIFAEFFSLGTITSAQLVCDVVASGNVEKWIMGKASHEKLELLLINTCFDRCLL